MIAALYVQTDGAYFGLPDVDPWDEQRDARTYDGPWPVVAHPPCSRWCQMAAVVEKRYGHKRGDDGGMFAAALASVRRHGGVLEHPAFSKAWPAHGLNAPQTDGEWWAADFEGGWTCYVEQGKYGHPARKGTWLYAVGVPLPPLRWGRAPAKHYRALVGWAANRKGTGRLVGSATVKEADDRVRIGKAKAAATPPEFRTILLDMARSAA